MKVLLALLFCLSLVGASWASAQSAPAAPSPTADVPPTLDSVMKNGDKLAVVDRYEGTPLGSGLQLVSVIVGCVALVALHRRNRLGAGLAMMAIIAIGWLLIMADASTRVKQTSLIAQVGELLRDWWGLPVYLAFWMAPAAIALGIGWATRRLGRKRQAKTAPRNWTVVVGAILSMVLLWVGISGVGLVQEAGCRRIKQERLRAGAAHFRDLDCHARSPILVNNPF